MQSHSPVLTHRRQATHRRAAPGAPERDRALRRRPVRQPRQLLAEYHDRDGSRREIIARPAFAGSVLVIDQAAVTCDDRRLIAHLGDDEPAENAALVCGHYLKQTGGRGCRCRAVVEADARRIPLAEQAGLLSLDCRALDELRPTDRAGCTYRLELTSARMSIPELRWCRRNLDPSASPQPLSMREVIASLESYEPICTMTVGKLAQYRADAQISTTTLQAELVRVQASPIVLNRRLREVVLAAVALERLSMSEIAIRCGRIKRDAKGKVSGETSWLARRLGMLPEGGQSTPTPWIHTDVLALIARNGLAISPREVEAD
jgi:hypothetical protein